jgi:hypothetical protein
MRDFNEADRKKKSSRINLPENPGNLSAEDLCELENTVKAAVEDGYLPCPAGWRIAVDAGVSRLDVGAIIDKLGVRITACQLGCFTVEKTPSAGSLTEPLREDVARRVEALHEKGELTCSSVFALARERNVALMSVANAANLGGYKIRRCQLGCF